YVLVHLRLLRLRDSILPEAPVHRGWGRLEPPSCSRDHTTEDRRLAARDDLAGTHGCRQQQGLAEVEPEALRTLEEIGAALEAADDREPVVVPDAARPAQAQPLHREVGRARQPLADTSAGDFLELRGDRVDGSAVEVDGLHRLADVQRPRL